MTHPLARLPVSVILRLPTAPQRILAVMISRGVAPLMPLADLMARTEQHGAGAALVAGYPAVEAKNRAATLALQLGASLLLVEDDTLTDADVWAAALRPVTDTLPVRLASARCRNGDLNTKFHADGSVWYSGTSFVLIPHPVLLALAEPIFVANEYGIAGGELFLRGPSSRGHHSDVHFWKTLRDLEPHPRVELIGQAVSLVHRLNRDAHDLETVEEVGVA